MRVGILALQGAVTPHSAMLQKLGAEPIEVKSPADLAGCERLIMPGGESSTMLKLLALSKLQAPLIEFAAQKPVWGICAGAILLASEVRNPTQDSLGLIQIRAYRNHYGSQLDSFKAWLSITDVGPEIEVDFIRAPLLEPLSSEVQILATHQNQTVMLRQGNIFASSFHVELGADDRVHKYFLAA